MEPLVYVCQTVHDTKALVDLICECFGESYRAELTKAIKHSEKYKTFVRLGNKDSRFSRPFGFSDCYAPYFYHYKRTSDFKEVFDWVKAHSTVETTNGLASRRGSLVCLNNLEFTREDLEKMLKLCTM